MKLLDKFMPNLFLQSEFTYMACGPFTNHRERIKKFKETSDVNYICNDELDKAYFTHDAANSDSKDLANGSISDKIVKDRAYEIVIKPKYDEYKRGLASVVYNV